MEQSVKFSELGLNTEILRAVEAMGFEYPTDIQSKAIPYLLEQKGDFVGLAQTGTGKTAAFGLPMLNMIDTSQRIPQGLVICPTRELCLQISNEYESFSKYMKNVNVTAVYGGAPIEKQIRQIKKGTQVIVATPGRLQDLIKRKVVDLSLVNMVVLDEADEMLNMGFKEDIFNILSYTPSDKSTWLFSATMPNEVAAIRKQFMDNPFEVTIGRKNQGASTVDHSYCIVRRDDKYEALKRILDFNPEIFGVIFCRTKRDTQEIADKLIQDGYDVDALHGDLSQHQRDLVMNKFRNRRIKVLAATDVAARGIDVDNVTHVIHYSIPDDKEAYNHRSGRTGRAGNKGKSMAIILKKDLQKLKSISKMINKEFSLFEIPSGKETCEKQLFHLVDNIANQEVHPDLEQHMDVIRQKFEHFTKEQLLETFVSYEFSELLNYYVGSRDINVSAEGDRKNRDKSNKKDPGRLFINLGKKDGIDKRDLEDLVCSYADFSRNSITDVTLMDSYSFINVVEKDASKVINGMHGQEFHSRNIVVEFASQKSDDRKSRSNRRDRRNSSGGGSKNSRFKGGRNRRGSARGSSDSSSGNGRRGRRR